MSKRADLVGIIQWIVSGKPRVKCCIMNNGRRLMAMSHCLRQEHAGQEHPHLSQIALWILPYQILYFELNVLNFMLVS